MSYLMLQQTFILFKSFLLLLLINLSSALLSSYLSVNRPWINLDYSLLFVLFAFGYVRITVILTPLFILFDLFAIFVQVFPFIRISDALYLISMLPYVSSMYMAGFVLLLLFFFAKTYIFVRARKFFCRKTALISLNLVLFTHFILGYVVFPDAFRNHRVLGEDIYIQSQTEYFLSTRVFGFSEMFRGDDDPFESYEGASAIKIMQQQGTVPDRLLLIVVESWGEPQNKRVQDALLEPLRGLEFHEWQEGLFSFSGATVAAEFRELCNLHLKHFNLQHVEEGFDVCLPQLLQRDGFATRAMHGATGNVYDRHVWYPKIGFEEQVFFESRQWPRRCHSFPGACDLDMFGELELFFGAPGKRFMYWLTLNSHSIYDSRDILEDHFNCKEFDIDEGESCRNLKLHAQFFHGLAKQLQSPVFHGTHVMLVSDHEPRILNQNEMNRYFHAGEIPWVSFTLR